MVGTTVSEIGQPTVTSLSTVLPVAIGSPPTAVGGAKEATHAPSQPQAIAPRQCQWALTVKREKLEYERLLQLTWLDRYYYTTKHKAQRLGFRFSEALDPTLMAQSLKLAIAEYPVVGSKVIINEGKEKFHFDAENVTVRLIHVEAELLQSMDDIEQLCDIFHVPDPEQKNNPLFKAFLFKSSDPRAGSVLICVFQHCMGDAMAYALFVSTWSRCYKRISTVTQQPPDLDMPPDVWRDYHVLKNRNQRSADSPLYRHFAFSVNALQALKREVMQDCFEGEILTTNDILCAQCAIAVAPFRFEKLGIDGDMDEEVRIFILVDSRGRTKDGRALTTWGNFVSDVAVDFAWHELLDPSSFNVVRVARKIRRTLMEQVALMEHFAKFDDDRGNRKKLRKLFCWNSWARVGETLRQVEFEAQAPSNGRNLQEMRWYNASWHPDVETVVVEPAACVNAEGGDPLLVVHVAAPLATAEAEGEILKRFWGRAILRED